MGIQSNGTAKGEGPILWQLVYPYLVYKHYQYYGDLSLLKQEYPYLKKQLDYLLDYNLNKLVELSLIHIFTMPCMILSSVMNSIDAPALPLKDIILSLIHI